MNFLAGIFILENRHDLWKVQRQIDIFFEKIARKLQVRSYLNKEKS